MFDFLFALTGLFCCLLRLKVMRRNVTARLFSQGHRGRPLCIQLFIWTGSSSINHSWHQKARGTGLLGGENHILLRFLVLTQYRSVTDRRMPPIAYTMLAKLALRCAVIKIINKFNKVKYSKF